MQVLIDSGNDVLAAGTAEEILLDPGSQEMMV
jgi:hypothetical protein